MNEHETLRKIPPVVACQDDEAVVAELEKLDDLIYPAIDGDEQVLAAALQAWENAKVTLGSDVLRESRSQYLRHALATWNFLRHQTIDRPHRLLTVGKILMLLIGDDIS